SSRRRHTRSKRDWSSDVCSSDLRVELDHWAKRHRCQCRLQGFSTHYSFSFPNARKSKLRNANKLAYLLAHILPAPVILLASNRQIGRASCRERVEIAEVGGAVKT